MSTSIQLALMVAFCADQFVVTLQRMPSGKLDLVSLSVDHLAL